MVGLSVIHIEHTWRI